MQIGGGGEWGGAGFVGAVVRLCCVCVFLDKCLGRHTIV
jgi:hypothetical protein